MEVHHSHMHHNKKLGDYLAEFFMIFLAVTAGYFAENIREHISDHNKEREYINSLRADLQSDTSQIAAITKLLFRNIKGEDSLILQLKNYKNEDSITTRAYTYYLKYTIGVPQVLFNERTISQLMATGNMRLISKKHMSDSIMNYVTLVNFNKIQAQYYNDQFKKCFEYSNNIFDFTITHFALNEDLSNGRRQPLNLHNLQLISTDTLQIKKYCNQLTLLQSIATGYALNLRAARKAAVQLIQLINKEYQLEKE